MLAKDLTNHQHNGKVTNISLSLTLVYPIWSPQRLPVIFQVLELTSFRSESELDQLPYPYI